MITDAENKELSHAGFYPVNSGHYSFEYRGVRLSVVLGATHWFCRDDNRNTVAIPVQTPAIQMAERLKQWILDTTPAAQLREEGYRQLDWISSSVRAALAQERARAACVPFCGELDSSDADDSIPACYGL